MQHFFFMQQDYEDSITFPKEGANRGSCVFAQTAVMGKRSSRDTRQQSRLVRGNAKGFTISTIDHLKGITTNISCLLPSR